MMAATPASAEDIVAYQAEGDAPASATDPRVMALDEAFARAVSSALVDLVDGNVRTARKGELDKEIVTRARLWVAKYSVTKDETVDDRRELTVSVRVDRDKIRAKLGELRIAIKEATQAAVQPDAQPAAKTITILLRLVTPSATRAAYGATADPNAPGVSALTTLLRGAGFAVRRAPASGDPSSTLSDDEAAVLANEAKAENVAVASVTVGEPVPVRGLPTTAALVSAELRVLDKAKKVMGQASAQAAAKGDELGYAIDRALVAAAADVLPPTPTKLSAAAAYQGDDTPIAEPGIVLVRLPAKTPWALVLAEQKYLAGAKGVKAATMRRVSPSGWVIGVTTAESIEQIARIAKKPPATDTTSAVKIVGNVVEVTLAGAL
jgi:Holliday junction resolvase